MSAVEPLERTARRPTARLARPVRWRVGPDMRSFAALGDSFTAGTGCGPGERWADRLATRLAAGRPGFQYRNFAVEGATSEQVLDQVDPALRFGPDLATVVCGANDVLFSVRPDAHAYAGRLRLIFRLLSDSDPEIRLLTATAPERWDFLELGPRTRSRLERGIVDFNAATRTVADELDVPCLDVAAHPGLDEAENFIADGLHPSAHGHDQAATGFARLLELDREGDR